MAARRLVLSGERLGDLTPDELVTVVGGRPPAPTTDCPDWTYYCVTGPAICDISRWAC